MYRILNLYTITFFNTYFAIFRYLQNKKFAFQENAKLQIDTYLEKSQKLTLPEIKSIEKNGLLKATIRLWFLAKKVEHMAKNKYCQYTSI